MATGLPRRRYRQKPRPGFSTFSVVIWLPVLTIRTEPDRLPRYKAGQRRPTATVEALYTRPAQALVARRYAFEIDTFGYRFPASEAAALRAA